MSWQTIKKALAPPVFEGDEQKSRNAVLVNIIVLVTLVASAAGFLVMLIEGGTFQFGTVERIFAGVTVVFLVLFLLLRAGYLRIVSILVPLALWIGFTFAIYTFDGIRDGAVIGYFFIIVVAGLSSSTAVLFSFTGLSLLSMVVVYLAEVNGLIVTGLTDYSMPIFSDVLIMGLVMVSSALLLRSIVGGTVSAYDRARETAEALGESNVELEANRNVLQAQTYALERRTQYLEMTAEIARDTASLLDRDVLFERVTNLLGQRLPLCRAGVFLVDETRTWAAAERVVTFNEGISTTIDADLRLEIGGDSTVGQLIEAGEPYVTADALGDTLFSDVSIADDVQSEMVLPLRVRDETIGAISVQSATVAAFTEEDVAVMQTVADLVAVALNNIRLFAQVEESLRAERRARGELIREAWVNLLKTESSLGYLDDGAQTLRADDVWQPEMEVAFRSGTAVADDDGGRCRAVPVRVGDSVIGVIHGCKPEGTWTAEEITLLDTLTEQLNATIERARLYRDTQRRAADEQMLNRITANLARSLDMDAILQTVVSELGASLPVDEVSISVGGQRAAASREGERA